MPRYRSNLSARELNFSDSGGPIVGPGEEFEHDIPQDQAASLLRSGFISAVPSGSDIVPAVLMPEMGRLHRALFSRLTDT